MGPTSRSHARQERTFEFGAQAQQRGIPLPGGIDARETAVVQLVTHAQGQLQVKAVGIRIADGRADACEMVA